MTGRREDFKWQEGKYFFFEKKKQKTFDYKGLGFHPGRLERSEQKNKSFLFLFFKKESAFFFEKKKQKTFIYLVHGPRSPHW